MLRHEMRYEDMHVKVCGRWNGLSFRKVADLVCTLFFDPLAPHHPKERKKEIKRTASLKCKFLFPLRIPDMGQSAMLVHLTAPPLLEIRGKLGQVCSWIQEKQCRAQNLLGKK